ncbi:unnamed protein product [Owenia fusiformis]|uniref:Apple domain-containing protein n=1 Tax=Owenia fusiformis TaxID=6347 RepID=A0A8S4NE85_OWEFU|nr:unnamed protein product [Owenia fusiformis]
MMDRLTLTATEVPSSEFIDLGLHVCITQANDVIYYNVSTNDECKELCLNETSIVCWSVEYGEEGGSHSKMCQLSTQYSGIITLSNPCGPDVIYSERIPVHRQRGVTVHLRHQGQRLEKHILHMTSYSSRLECTQSCNIYLYCVAFDFNKNIVTNNCQLLTQKSDVSAPGDLVEDANWNYYEVTGRVWE